MKIRRKNKAEKFSVNVLICKGVIIPGGEAFAIMKKKIFFKNKKNKK
jgi:hypothetical protein